MLRPNMDLKELISQGVDFENAGDFASLLVAFTLVYELVEKLKSEGKEKDEAGDDGQPAAFDLQCPHCKSIMFQPVTLGDGRSYCKPCVAKLGDKVPGGEVGFGGAVYVISWAVSASTRSNAQGAKTSNSKLIATLTFNCKATTPSATSFSRWPPPPSRRQNSGTSRTKSSERWV